MAIFLPRIFSRERGSSLSRSLWPAKRADPPIRAVLGSSPMMASDVTDLPEPDSPTMPSTSPGCRPKETPRTARTTPSSLGKSTVRFSTSRIGCISGPDPLLLRVEGVAQAVADEVDGEADENDEHP